ncbi:hypothetical protein [Nocardia thailandica]
MNQPMVETPVMGLPRDEMMRMALATRTLAALLREIRERRGRAAFDDTMNAVRKSSAAQLNALGRFSADDLAEWNRLSETDGIRAELEPESGMTIRVAPLSGGRFGVQAGWPDHHAETVAGSHDMADRIADWLRTNPSRESVDAMHEASEEFHRSARAERGRDRRPGGQAESELSRARRWARENRPEWSEEWELRYAAADSSHDRRQDEAEMVRYWRMERARDRAEAEGQTSAQEEQPQQAQDGPLACRLRGKVPDRVLDDPRWETAEQQFAALVTQGADPDQLAAAVAAVDFDGGKVRAPSGFAAWVMRDAVKNGRVRTTATEDEARREVAQEWLDGADATSPFDRARAATLVGEIDDAFDAALAAKFPGILDQDDVPGEAEAKSRPSDSASAEDTDEEMVFVVDVDGEVVEVPFVAAEPKTASTPSAGDPPEAEDVAGQQRGGPGQKSSAQQAAEAVMTPPGDKKNTRQRKPRRGAPPAGEQTPRRTHGRSH